MHSSSRNKKRTTLIHRGQSTSYPQKKVILKSTKREFISYEFDGTTQKTNENLKSVVRSVENIEAFDDLVNQMFPKAEVENSILKNKHLASALRPLKHRAKKVKMIEPVEFSTDDDNTLPQFYHLYSTPKVTYINDPIVSLENTKPTQRSRSLKTHKKHVEVVSDVDRNNVYANFNEMSTPIYNAVTDSDSIATFRELLIEDDTPSNLAQKAPESYFLNVADQQANNQIHESGSMSGIAPVRGPPPPSLQEAVPVESYDDKPSTRAVELIQTDNLSVLDFDGERAGLKSHLHDRNKINSIIKAHNVKGDLKEVVISDPWEMAPPNVNTEFGFHRDILPRLLASNIPLYANLETQFRSNKGLNKGGREFGLLDIEMFGDGVPYKKYPSADNPNLPTDSNILKEQYDSGNLMKELQVALLVDDSSPHSTKKNLDLGLFMLPEKRRFNIIPNKLPQKY